MIRLAGLSLILFSLSAHASDIDQYPTCKAFSSEVEAGNALTSEEQLSSVISSKQVLFLGESHSGSAVEVVKPWLIKTLDTQNFDCLFLEIPSDISTNSDKQYVGDIENHPYLAKKETTNPIAIAWLDYLHALVRESNSHGLKIYHIDLNQEAQKQVTDVVGLIEARNAAMAETIRSLFANGSCKKAVAQVGIGHLTSNFHSGMAMKVIKVKSLPEQEALQDVSFVSLNFSNNLFNYLMPESLPYCFGNNSGRFVNTAGLKTNLPYSQELGRIKDFNYILLPEPSQVPN